MRTQQPILVIILKASTSIVCSAVRMLTEKFRRQTSRYLEAAFRCLLSLILIVDPFFALFTRLCLSNPKSAHQMGKALLGVGSSDTDGSNNSRASSASVFPYWKFFHF